MPDTETAEGPQTAGTVATAEHGGPVGPVAAPVRDLTGISLRAPGLVLREFGEADLDVITEACQDELIQRYTTLPSPYSRSDAEKFVLEISPKGRAAGTDAVFGVFEAGGAGDLAAWGGLVGAVGMHRIAHLDAPFGGNGELGYWTAPWARRRGLTARAAAAVCRWGLDELGLARIEWYAVAGNEGSWGVARRCGFVREGTLRAWLVHRGARHDAWAASLLPGELPDPV